jgi:uncharacterized protein
MDPLEVIAANCRKGAAAYEILVEHSSLVAQKALALARSLSHLNPDMDFIHEAAMLHDIGIIMTDAPKLGCTGALPYICHGFSGRAILERAGLPRHGLVCERHVGVGITMEDIRSGRLPIPLRDMTPQTLEEQIICYADKFYSKNGHRHPVLEKSAEEIVLDLSAYGQDKVDRFLSWRRQFEGTSNPGSSQG